MQSKHLPLDRAMGAQFWANALDYMNRVDIVVTRNDLVTGNRHLLSDLSPTGHWIDVGDDMLQEATLSLNGELAKSLMTALWDAGVRPAQRDRDPQAEMAAVRSHLSDMRTLVARSYKIEEWLKETKR